MTPPEGRRVRAAARITTVTSASSDAAAPAKRPVAPRQRWPLADRARSAPAGIAARPAGGLRRLRREHALRLAQEAEVDRLATAEALQQAAGPTGGRRRRGRPSSFTPERVADLLMGVRSGQHPVVAAFVAGISPATYFRWLADPRRQFEVFRRRLDQADAEAEVMVTTRLFMSSDWRARLVWLQQLHPERWGRPGHPLVPGPEDAEAVPALGRSVDISGLISRAQIEALLARARTAGAESETDY